MCAFFVPPCNFLLQFYISFPFGSIRRLPSFLFFTWRQAHNMPARPGAGPRGRSHLKERLPNEGENLFYRGTGGAGAIKTDCIYITHALIKDVIDINKENLSAPHLIIRRLFSTLLPRQRRLDGKKIPPVGAGSGASASDGGENHLLVTRFSYSQFVKSMNASFIICRDKLRHQRDVWDAQNPSKRSLSNPWNKMFSRFPSKRTRRVSSPPVMSPSGRVALWVTKAPGFGKQSTGLSAVKLEAAVPEISDV